MRGRPLWFLGIVVSGWAAARVVTLWPDVLTPLSPPAAAAEPRVAMVAPTPSPTAASLSPSSIGVRSTRAHVWQTRSTPRPRTEQSRAFAGSVVKFRPEAMMTLDQGGGGDPIIAREAPAVAPGFPAPIPGTNRSRWSGSAWAIARAGGGDALLSPLLGGSQAGMRVAYALDRAGKTAVFWRAATPIARGPAEFALGGQWRPGRVPITLYAEARASDGRVAPTAGVFGGATASLRGFRLDSYGQLGVIARHRASAFGDGQLRVTRRIGPVEAGGGLWAAAQQGAARVDIGPSLALPIHASPVALRLTLDWRHRIAGNARPASGPALSLGADF